MNKINENNENKDEIIMLKNEDNSKFKNLTEKSQNKVNKKKFTFIILFTLLFIPIFYLLNYFKQEMQISLNDFFELQFTHQKNSFIINDTLIKDLNDFMKLCKNGTLINGIQKSSQKPKITVVVPVYNAEKTIKMTIRSIQNQNMSDIEIIIIDDFSQDGSLRIIERLQNEDSRIKLLKNKHNRGALYTRSIGTLNAKGKYIMPIDNDDLFIKNIFNICYEEAELNNIDIIEFSGYNTYYNYILPNSTSNMTLNIPLYLQIK